MTNHEAIRLIRNLPTMCEFTDAYGEPIDSDAYYEAVDMAISALQAQEPCRDTISRQTAIDSFKMDDDGTPWSIDDIVYRLEQFPSAEEMLSAQPEEYSIEMQEADIDEAMKHLRNAKVMILPPTQSEIVRCKDCKYWRKHKYAKETKRYIPFCGFNVIYTKSDYFCSRAERRQE